MLRGVVENGVNEAAGASQSALSRSVEPHLANATRLKAAGMKGIATGVDASS